MDAEIQKVSLSYKIDSTEPSLNVYKVDASFSIYYIDPSFNVTFTAPTFDVAYTAATYDVIYVNLTPTTIEIGIFLLKESLFDFGFITDQQILSVGKNPSEAASFETTVRYDFGKPLSETAAFSDSPVKNVGSARTDDFFVVDQIDTIGFSKGVTDFGDLATEIRFDVTKLLSETPTLSDTHTNTFGKALLNSSIGVDTPEINTGKSLQDAWSATESSQIIFGKVPSDTAVFATETALALTKLLVSNIYVTDDVDGEASIEDDQNMLFNKARVDLGSVVELLTRQVDYFREFSDFPVGQDNAALRLDKEFTDSAVLGDEAAVATDYRRLFAETAGWQDNVFFAVSAVLTDNGYVLESNVKSFGKGNSDSASVADSGSLYGQDYVDNPFYFAEDYVGYSTTF